jgi:hypothetical protein
MSQVRIFIKHFDICMIICQVHHVDQHQKVQRPESLISICFVMFDERCSSLASLKVHNPPQTNPPTPTVGGGGSLTLARGEGGGSRACDIHTKYMYMYM